MCDRLQNKNPYELTTLQDLIRISVGTEHIDDIIADFVQSFKGAATKPDEQGANNGDVTGDASAPTKPTV